MDKTEKLICRQEIGEELLIAEPNFADVVMEKMRTELGKALADKICDGKAYSVIMVSPHLALDVAAFNPYCVTCEGRVLVTPIVKCQECRKRKDNKFCLEHMRYEKDDGFCYCGERKSDEWQVGGQDR